MTIQRLERPARPARPASLATLLNGPRVRRAGRPDRLLYAAVDVMAELTDDADPAVRVAELRAMDGPLSPLWETAAFGGGVEADALPAAGVVDLVWTLGTPRARRYQRWAADAAGRAVAPPPPRQPWADRRAAGMGSRHDLTAEWAARGARSGDDYRELTNVLSRAAFDADVIALRAAKGLTDHPGEGLRDHMTDVELLLTTVAETAAVELARRRDARGMDDLRAVAAEAGGIAAGVRRAIVGPEWVASTNVS